MPGYGNSLSSIQSYDLVVDPYILQALLSAAPAVFSGFPNLEAEIQRLERGVSDASYGAITEESLGEIFREVSGSIRSQLSLSYGSELSEIIKVLPKSSLVFQSLSGSAQMLTNIEGTLSSSGFQGIGAVVSYIDALNRYEVVVDETLRSIERAATSLQRLDEGSEDYGPAHQLYGAVFGITVVFKDGQSYTYTEQTIGTPNLDAMIDRAEAGSGLARYIQSNVTVYYGYV